MSRILVTGATGHLSRSVFEQLLKNMDASKITALVRDIEKADSLLDQGIEIRQGCYEDPILLEKAMQDIDKLLLISSSSLGNRFQHHKNVIDAAANAGVKNIVFTGVSFNDPSTSYAKDVIESLFQTEEYIKACGMTYTFLRNTLYADTIPDFIGQDVFETGIYLPAGDGKVPFALRSEMGEATANVLLSSGHANKIYHLTGNDLYSYDDIAAELSRLSGKKVIYNNPDCTVYSEKLKESGVPEQFVSFLTGFITDKKNRQYENTSTDLENLLGRKPTTIGEVLKELYDL
jgi:Predicted nucleoside-diphosphate-sugar epimerases